MTPTPSWDCHENYAALKAGVMPGGTSACLINELELKFIGFELEQDRKAN
jgi:hypothetical protein